MMEFLKTLFKPGAKERDIIVLNTGADKESQPKKSGCGCGGGGCGGGCGGNCRCKQG